jgi:endoglucanase
MIDGRMIASREFGNEIRELGAAAGIPVQMAFSGGGTDAQPFQPEGVPVVPLTIPTRYTHSAVEMVHLDDVEETIKLVCAIVDAA